MDLNFFSGGNNQDKGKKKQNDTKVSSSVAGAIFIFMLITAVYLVISSGGDAREEISISDLAKSVSAGEVRQIVVEGDKLSITFQTDEVKTAKKETDSSLSQTLFNYGVTSEALTQTEIEIKSESGFAFWLFNILPFLLPIVFILLFFWYLSRQVKGAGIQALSFGQSKARITDPNDKN